MSDITVQEIADGGSFDTVEGIRAIARFLVSPAPVTVEQILDEEVPPLQAVTEAFGAKIAAVLLLGGYDTLEKVRSASDDELVALRGIGDTALATIRAAQGG